MSEDSGYSPADARRHAQGHRWSARDFHFGPLLGGDAELQVLPRLGGMHCLELGCGLAHNSLALLEAGAARCTALDASAAMLELALDLAERERPEDLRQGRLDFIHAPAEDFLRRDTRHYDLIHSVLAWQFFAEGAKAIALSARRLRPGGWLLLSVPHPAWEGAWLEMEGGGGGKLVENYFGGLVERGGQEQWIQPPSWWFTQLRAAGLEVERFLEPQPSGPGTSPYVPQDWAELMLPMELVPVVQIWLARMPSSAR